MIADMIEAMPIPVLFIGSDQRVRALNASCRALIGDHVVGRHYITALRQPDLLDKIEVVQATGKSADSVYLGREAGRDTHFAVHIGAAGDAVILTFQDQTVAQDMGQFRRDFVANVSHELRTPLTALMGFIETLQGAARDDPAARDRFLAIMAREAGRMTRLVDDLLSLSRLEANARVKPAGPVVLSQLVAGTLQDLQPVTDAAKAQVAWQDDSAGVSVPADAGELRQVVGNLVENAAKYGADGGTIQVTLGPVLHEPRLRGDGVRLVVKDDGQGIAPHHIARLTERFYRVDNHRSRAVGGTGLGLAIVKHIVNRHRGRLLIESDEGQGTRVTVILPIT